jgi:hypothetical protein
MAVDLHTHSRLSDGGVMPSVIIEMAIARRLHAIALTDHDLIDGNPEAARTAAGRIEFVPGVELSVEWKGHGMHLLAYWTEPDTPLSDRLDEIRRGRETRNLEIVDTLNGLGIPITIEEVWEEAEIGVIGRPHFAKVLVHKGVVNTVPEAFDQYLANGRPAYRKRMRVPADEMVELAWRSGAVPVVAHPHTLGDNREQFTELFPELKRLGVAGVECHYVEYTPDQRLRFARSAESLGLVATGGSDYHEKYKEGIEVGVGRGDLVVPDEALERLSERRKP